jgi:iron complex outermembrane receptor protein
MPRAASRRPSCLRSRLTPAACAAALAVGALGAAAPALAQNAPARPAASGELSTVTVTANRRVEDQQKVSVSVTALTGEALAERNVQDLSTMEGLVPGFTFGRSGVDARPALRGVRTENVAVNADTTIGFFVDGIYKSRAQQAMLGFMDLERVEVQRGPQGTLFGRNTFGGNVVVATTAPQYRADDAAAGISLGSFNRRRLDGVFNAPLGDDAALRVAAAVERADPWVRNDFNRAAGLFDQDNQFARVGFRSRPTREMEVVIRLDVTSQKGNGGSAFGYKQLGTYVHGPSCQQLFNAGLTVLNVRPGNRDAVADCTRSIGAGAGTGANAAGSTVDLGIPIHRPGDAYRIDTDQQTTLRTSDSNLSAEVSWKLSAFTLKSITGVADFASERSADSDFSASTIAIDFQRTAATTLSQEFQLLSEGSGPFGYVAGVYLFRDDLEGKFINQQLPRVIRSSAAPELALAQNGAGFYDLQRPDTSSNAIYGQLNWKLGSALTLTAGARYTRDEKRFRFANANSVLPLVGGAPDGTQITLATPAPGEAAYGAAGATNCTGSNAQPGFNCLPGTNTVVGATYNKATFSKATGRLSADWQLAPQNLVFATLSTGFRSGGFNSGQALEGVRTFRPEEVRAIEVGSKNRFLGNTLQLNVAAFSNRYTDLQEQRQVPLGATTISTIFNAAKAKANGLEIETQWRATPALQLGASVSLLDAKYTSFPDVALPFGTSILVTDASQTTPQTDANGVVIAPAGQRRILAPGYNCRVVPGTGGAGQPAAAFGCDLTGNRLPYSPERQAGLFFKYDIGLGSLGTLTPLVQVNYSSGFFGQPTNAEIERQPAYTKVDLRLNWRITDTLSVQATVDNATDKQTLNRFVWGGGGALQASAAAPRTFGLRLAYSNF